MESNTGWVNVKLKKEKQITEQEEIDKLVREIAALKIPDKSQVGETTVSLLKLIKEQASGEEEEREEQEKTNEVIQVLSQEATQRQEI